MKSKAQEIWNDLSEFKHNDEIQDHHGFMSLDPQEIEMLLSRSWTQKISMDDHFHFPEGSHLESLA